MAISTVTISSSQGVIEFLKGKCLDDYLEDDTFLSDYYKITDDNTPAHLQLSTSKINECWFEEERNFLNKLKRHLKWGIISSEPIFDLIRKSYLRTICLWDDYIRYKDYFEGNPSDVDVFDTRNLRKFKLILDAEDLKYCCIYNGYLISTTLCLYYGYERYDESQIRTVFRAQGYVKDYDRFATIFRRVTEGKFFQNDLIKCEKKLFYALHSFVGRKQNRFKNLQDFKPIQDQLTRVNITKEIAENVKKQEEETRFMRYYVIQDFTRAARVKFFRREMGEPNCRLKCYINVPKIASSYQRYCVWYNKTCRKRFHGRQETQKFRQRFYVSEECFKKFEENKKVMPKRFLRFCTSSTISFEVNGEAVDHTISLQWKTKADNVLEELKQKIPTYSENSFESPTPAERLKFLVKRAFKKKKCSGNYWYLAQRSSMKSIMKSMKKIVEPVEYVDMESLIKTENLQVKDLIEAIAYASDL